ncbi:MAG TPA: hypothetical protein VI670_22720 [Thermoanaerobaculia bacterium]
MICPECGSEYREGFVRCADCDVELAAPPPALPDDRAKIELVKVWEGGNPALVPVLESLLDDAGIEFSTTSENLQDLFAWGRFGGGFNYAIGPIMIYVRTEDEVDARAIVAGLAQPAPPELPEEP